MKNSFLKRMATVLIFMLSACLLMTSAYAAGEHYYVGTKKGSQTGIQAYIKPTEKLSLTESGESAWVSNVSGSGDNKQWVQTGFRYYYNYGDDIRTYVETKIDGVYNMSEIGYQIVGIAVNYKVSYESDKKWHAYIGGTDKGAFSLSFSSATVEAMAESHSSKIDLGPFAFTQVKYKNSSGTWKNMDVKPTADSPFSVDVTNNYTYTAY